MAIIRNTGSTLLRQFLGPSSLECPITLTPRPVHDMSVSGDYAIRWENLSDFVFSIPTRTSGFAGTANAFGSPSSSLGNLVHHREIAI